MYPSDALDRPAVGTRYRPTRTGARPATLTADDHKGRYVDQSQETSATADRPSGPAAGLLLSTATWYTLFLFAAAAPAVLGPLFFVQYGGANGTLIALATAGVAFVARPLGALVFGHLGDTLGRRAALLSALTLAGASIVLIGALPVAATIGALAPLLLVSLQLTHGIAIGGAWSGMALSLTETAPPRRRGLIGGFVQGGVACGALLANLVVFVAGGAFSATTFKDWGWRVPFLAGGVLFVAVAAIALRRPTPNHEKQDTPAGRRGPISTVLRRPGRLVLAAGLLFAANATFYVTVIETVEYGATDLKLARTDMIPGALLAAVVGVLASLGGGALADKLGRRPVVILGAVTSGLWAFPFFWLVDTAALELIAFAMVISAFASALGYGAVAAYLTELYEYRSRYTGTALAYHLGAAVAGGAAQVAVLELPTYVENGVSWFLLLSAALTITCALALPETRPRPEDETRLLRTKRQRQRI